MTPTIITIDTASDPMMMEIMEASARKMNLFLFGKEFCVYAWELDGRTKQFKATLNEVGRIPEAGQRRQETTT